MITATKEHYAIRDAIEGYRDDPIGFAIHVLGMRPDWIWPKMVELAEAVRDHQKVAVRAGHFVSKTYSLGRIIVPWFKTCFQPSPVVTTAPSDNQVKNQLWREIHASHSGSRIDLGGRMTALMWDMIPSQEVLDNISTEDRPNWQKNFAVGFSTSPDSNVEHATKMQGWHNEWVLVVIDEACGMLPQIWRTAIEGLINDELCKVVAVGNPTDPECDFAQACHSSDMELQEGSEPYMSDEGWYVVTIDARQTPNYLQRKRVIPGLASYEWVQNIIKKYGAEGDGTRYRVMGLFPTFKEGTFYGYKLAKCRREERIGNFPHLETAPVYTFSDYGDMNTASIFAQFIKGRIRIIDCYWDPEGLGAPNWATVCDAKKYHYRGHWAGPDLTGSGAKNFQTGSVTRDILANLGYDVYPVMKHKVDEGIEAVRDIWDIIEINESTCGTFIKAAAGYGKEKNLRKSTDEHTVYHDKVAKTWHRHMMDALRHLAIQFIYDEIGGANLGSPYPEIQYAPDCKPKQKELDYLSLKGL